MDQIPQQGIRTGAGEGESRSRSQNRFAGIGLRNREEEMNIWKAEANELVSEEKHMSA